MCALWYIYMCRHSICRERLRARGLQTRTQELLRGCASDFCVCVGVWGAKMRCFRGARRGTANSLRNRPIPTARAQPSGYATPKTYRDPNNSPAWSITDYAVSRTHTHTHATWSRLSASVPGPSPSLIPTPSLLGLPRGEYICSYIPMARVPTTLVCTRKTYISNAYTRTHGTCVLQYIPSIYIYISRLCLKRVAALGVQSMLYIASRADRTRAA